MIKVWKEEDKKEPEYFLKLAEISTGPVLVIVDSAGEIIDRGYLLSFRDRKVVRHSGVHPTIAKRMGLVLTDDMKLKKEEE